MTVYRIKDWHRFQHFKDRRPPWIKLYRDLLDDPDWHELGPADAKALVMLWLIASEGEDGALPDVRRLAFRLRMAEDAVIQSLKRLSHWLEQDDIATISPRYRDDAPETETETETETEGDKEPKGSSSADTADHCPHDAIRSLFREVLPELAQPRTWTGARVKNLRSRWREDPERQSLDWWRGFFEYVRKCPLLMGRHHSRDHPGWAATLDWLVKPENFAKVIDGKYEVRDESNV